MIEKVTVYMGSSEIEADDFKKYVCNSAEVSDIVNKVYDRCGRKQRARGDEI